MCLYNVTLFFLQIHNQSMQFLINFINQFTPLDGAPNQILNQTVYLRRTRTTVVYLNKHTMHNTMQLARKVITLKFLMQLVFLVHWKGVGVVCWCIRWAVEEKLRHKVPVHCSLNSVSFG